MVRAGAGMEENTVKYQLAVRELNELVIFDEWLEKKEALETAKEQFDFVDKPFRKALKDLFDRFGITRLENDYIDIMFKNGYTRKTWDDEKLKIFIYSHGESPDDYMKEKDVSATLQIKYKE